MDENGESVAGSSSEVNNTFLDSNLNLLEGLRAYSQETLENEVSRQLENEISARDRERELVNLRSELRQVELDIAKHEDGLKLVEKRLEDICSGQHFVNSRKCQALLDEQEKLRVKSAQAKVLREEIVKELEKYEQQPTTSKNSSESIQAATGSQDDAEIENEPEDEKNIRLGNLTAFGSILKSELKKGDFGSYFKELQREQQEESEDDDRLKRKNKASDGKAKPCPLSRKRRNETSVRDDGWHTDYSDWESSEEEEENGTTSRNKKKKMKKNPPSGFGGKIVDDGNRDDYLERLEAWHETRTTEEIEEGSLYEELDGGLKVPVSIWKRLYHYQKVAVQWLWELHLQKTGGILADEMGLGKTIQVIAFLASLSFSHKDKRKEDKNKKGPTSLIVCPTTVMQQWVGEFHAWWPPLRVTILHDSGSFNGSRASLIQSVTSSQGVLITSFSGLVSNKADLLKQNFDYIILDEGHKIRNPDAQITLAVKEFPTSHRIILSGSPLQNNLKELWSLFDFIFPGRLGTLPVFMENFSIPITLGGYANASRTQVATAYKCATVLRDTINPYLLRRMKSDVREHINLPAKNEQVLFCRLTDEQRDIYRQYLHSPEVKHILDGRFKVFVGLIILRKICNHPDLHGGAPVHIGLASEDSPNVFNDPESEEFGYWKRSGKMIVVESLLKLWKEQGHKVLLFTQSRQMLQILEKFVRQVGYSYAKLDGSTSIGSRQGIIDKFNRSNDIFVFLLTTKVGGLGVNLTGANRVIIFDPDWNPSTDMQSRERAWRIGQNRDVTIYRLLTSGTIEEKIYHRQIFKQLLINRVLKDPAMQRRFFKTSDLHDLFSLNEGTSDKTESSAIFAGTNSEVKPKKRDKKDKEERSDKRHKERRDSRDKIKKPESVDSFKPKQEDEIKNGVKTDMSEEEKERERLREKVRQINLKFSQKKFSKNEAEGESSNSSRSRRHESRKSSKKIGAKFEGKIRVPNLVKCREYNGVNPNSQEESTSTNNSEVDRKQNDYVLNRLFKKTGVHSAMQHDVILEGADDVTDYMLIEAEAERVAKEAVQKLRMSRRQCFPAEAGVPTWTGANGAVAKSASSRPRFGRIGKKPKTGSSAPISASELLQRMKRRSNCAVVLGNAGGTGSGRDTELFRPDNFANNENGDKDHIELLTEIRNFVAFQADSAGEGEATTDDLLRKFQKKLPPKQSPLFKALLTEICTFHRHHTTNKGIWRLKDEFR